MTRKPFFGPNMTLKLSLSLVPDDGSCKEKRSDLSMAV